MTQPSARGVEGNNDYLGGMTIRAHPSGSRGWAFDVAGFQYSTFENIEYLSNSSGTHTELFRLASWFGTSNTTAHCYGNVIRHIYIDGQKGPEKVIWFTQDGLDSAGNPFSHRV